MQVGSVIQVIFHWVQLKKQTIRKTVQQLSASKWYILSGKLLAGAVFPMALAFSEVTRIVAVRGSWSSMLEETEETELMELYGNCMVEE